MVFLIMIPCSVPLFLFSLTSTLILPSSSSSHVSFNTWSVFQGIKHLNREWTTNKIVDKSNDGDHIKLDNVIMVCGDRKNCSSITQSSGSDESANEAAVNYTSPNLPVAEINRVLSTRNQSGNTVLPDPHVLITGNQSGSNSKESPAPSKAPLPAPSLSPSSTPKQTTPLVIITNKHQVWKSKVIIGVASGGVVMGVFIICIIVCCFRYKLFTPLIRCCLTTKNDQDIEAFLKVHGAVSQKRYKFAEVKKMTNSLKVKLGQGGFGAVYKGQLPSGIPVAVKLLSGSKRNGEEFMNEVASISRTSHVNIVSLLGFCFEGSKKALIYEFMANGSLEKFIYKRGTETVTSLSWENLYQISIGTARGLEYLHRGCNTRILHFDIKPHNILLDENLCPKISDFGLAKLCPRKESIISMADTRGTMGYVAPEMCNRQFGGVSHKSDVYTYGMMLLEMVGGRKNIDAEVSHTSEIYFPHLVHKRLALDKDLRPDEVTSTEENEIAKRMSIVGLWCIQTFPNDRPTMSKVVDMLEGNINFLEMPPKPMFSSPTRSDS